MMYELIQLAVILLQVISCHSNRERSAASCCKLLLQSQSSSADHLACIHSSYSILVGNHTASTSSPSSTSSTSPSLIFASFASDNIHSYSINTSLVNSIYFEKNNYHAKLLSADSGDDYHPIDRRWNKIMAAYNGLLTWASEMDVLIMIDADLIFIDFDYRVETVINNYPYADIILASDALDVGNTGFLIIRNTDWSKRFLQLWWNSKGAKHTFCDQHVLNGMYNKLKGTNETHRVQVVEAKLLNSKWPAVKTFDSSDVILHLMGEVNSYRNAMAAYASNVVCNSYTRLSNSTSNQTVSIPEQQFQLHNLQVPAQLNFTREVLIRLATSAIMSDRQSVLDICISQLDSHLLPSDKLFEDLRIATMHACDDERSYFNESTGHCVELYTDTYSLIERAFDATYTESSLIINGSADASGNSVGDYTDGILLLSNRRLSLLDMMTRTYFDMMYFLPSIGDKNNHLKKVLQLLDTLSNMIDMKVEYNIRYIQHKRAILHGSMLSFALEDGYIDVALENGIIAINMMGDILQSMQHNSSDLTDYPTHIIEYCESAYKLSQVFLHKLAYEDAFHWANIALNNTILLYKDYGAEVRIMADRLSSLHYNVAVIANKSGKYQIANTHIKLAQFVFLQYDLPLSSAFIASLSMYKELVNRVDTVY